jgi:hypothetical protein
MQPDSAETRIGRLEREMAGVKQQVDDIRSDVKDLTPIPIYVAEMKGAVARLELDITAIRVEQAQEKVERQAQQQKALDDSRSWRRTILILSISVMTAVIGAAATVIAAVL